MTDRESNGERRLKGIPVSSGIVIGKAHVINRSRIKVFYRYLIHADRAREEVKRFQKALKRTEEQLGLLKSHMPDHIKEHAFILESHLMILKDTMLTDLTVERILQERMNAEWALQKSLEAIRSIFEQIEDDYIKSRIADVENVVERIFRNLAGKTSEALAPLTERVIVVAHELTPADTVELDIANVMGFVTDVGGRTSHAAIMAQALQIPVVVGLEKATDWVEDGDRLIVDANAGEVIIHPSDATVADYEARHIEQERYRSGIIRESHRPATTRDGHRISIMANVEFFEEVTAAKELGGEAVGLYRTEVLYLRSKDLPSEEELYQDYLQVAKAVAPQPVTFRTLDLGGDKLAANAEFSNQANPALGLRAIRLCLKRPDMFRTQLRAILRASTLGNMRMMFPMISGMQEFRNAQAILNDVKAQLDREGVPYDRDMRVGIMIEVPSAVSMASVLARHVDFFSIGTNDLIQYALAIDRVNEHVAYMYEPFHPAILRMIREVVRAARKAGIPVALCGEMAGDPLCVTLLLGLGLDELSMNPGSIPLVKHLIRSVSLAEAQADFRKVIRLSTAREVRRFIVRRLHQLIPELAGQGDAHLSIDDLRMGTANLGYAAAK